MKTITFNTGAQYQAHGQMIGAVQIDRHRIAFADVSRGIDGVVTSTYPLTLDRDTVHRRYLSGDYELYRGDEEREAIAAAKAAAIAALEEGQG